MHQFQASVYREESLYVAQCLEVDIASQGATADEALANLREAIELFFETAPPEEQRRRVHHDVQITAIEAAIG